MRLSIEQAKKYLQGMHRLWLCDEREQPYNSEQCRDCDSLDNCLDIVLSPISMSDIAQDLLDTIEALQQENKQLKAQAAVMREALKSIYYGPYQLHKGYVEILENALATDAGKDYHNPADVEALKKVKYAIECLIKHYTGPAFSFLKYGKVIEVIDKAIGCGQDD